MTPGQDNRRAVSEEPSTGVLLVAALIWPGVGQFLQRRWLAGSIYAVGFLASLVFALIHAVRILAASYGFVDRELTDVEMAGIRASVWKMFIGLAVLIIVTAVSFVELYLSHVRRLRKELLSRHDFAGQH